MLKKKNALIVYVYVGAALFLLGSTRSVRAVDVLVYSDGTHHSFAATAALNIDPTATIANAAAFNGLLGSQSWDVVFIDCPGTNPNGGWQPTIDFIGNGGKVAMSFWDWDNSDGFGDPGLVPAFGATGTTNSFSVNGRTLTDAGTTAVFNGVTMPNSDWHDHWADDGDAFAFTLDSGTVGMANFSGITDPVMILGNGGRTIAAFVIDEAGGSWISDGSAVQLWENMYSILVPEPSTSCLLVIIASGLYLRARPRRSRIV